MRTSSVREIAKFAAGLAAADFLFVLWFSQAHLRSLEFFGMSLTQDIVWPALMFDLAVFLLFVHHGWNIGKIPQPRERTYALISGVIFGVVAVAHLWRVFSNAPIDIAGWNVPLWLSWVGVVLAAYLSYSSLHLAARLRK